MSHIKLKRGRKPGSGVHRWKPTTMKMNDFKFNPELFVPMKTNKKIDIERQKYIKLGAKMKKLRETKVQLNTFDITASLIISLMLEICGILAISLFAENKEKSFN